MIHPSPRRVHGASRPGRHDDHAPADGTTPAVRSLVDVLLARLDDSFDRPAAVDTLAAVGSGPGRAWTWGGLIASAVATAERLEAAGLRRGDRLAHLGRHSVEWIVIDLACLLSGVVHVALHPDSTRSTWIGQLRWLGVDGFVVSGGRRPPAAGDLPPRTPLIDPGAVLVSGSSPDQATLRSAVGQRAAL